MADRHKPEDVPFSVRLPLPPDDLKAWVGEQVAGRGISRSALIIEALREKREREDS